MIARGSTASRPDDAITPSVDRWTPNGRAAEPRRVIDAPDDRGGYVQATWTKSPLGMPPSAGVNKYRFWREIADASPTQARAIARCARGCARRRRRAGRRRARLLQLTSANGSSGVRWSTSARCQRPGSPRRTGEHRDRDDSAPVRNPATPVHDRSAVAATACSGGNLDPMSGSVGRQPRSGVTGELLRGRQEQSKLISEVIRERLQGATGSRRRLAELHAVGPEPGGDGE